MRLGLVGIDSSHADDFLRHFNSEARYGELRVTALWGREAPAARVAQLLALDPAVRAEPSLDRLLEAVDAVLVGDRDGRLHRAHALPALAAGKPVFVDKPLANSLADATAMLEAAAHSGAPLLSGSALRWQAETATLKARIAYLDPPLSVSAYGTWYPDSDYGGPIYYAIHAIELLQELLGPGWSDLRVAGGADPVVRCRFGDVQATLTFHPPGESGHAAFGAAVVAAGGIEIDQPVPLGDDYMLPVCHRIAQLLRTGRGMSRDELLAPIRMMEAIAAGLHETA
jgi:predicted dehydrogenase